MTVDLDFQNVNFAAIVRKLIAAGEQVVFEIHGDAFRQLQRHLVDGKIVEPAKLALSPQLRPLLGALVFAEVRERRVVLEEHSDRVVVRVVGANG